MLSEGILIKTGSDLSVHGIPLGRRKNSWTLFIL